MKKILLFALVLSVLLGIGGCGKRGNTLYVFNWSDYIDPDLIKEFERANNCKVRESTYDSNENMLTKVMSSRQAYDIVVPSGDHVSIMQRQNLLEPLDRSKLKNYGNLDPKLLAKASSFDPGNLYSVPYFWGLTGLIYNIKQVPPDVVATQSWSALGDPFFEGKQKITMLEDAREVVGAALIFAGFDPNDTSPQAMAEAEKVLLVWDKNITQYDSESFKTEVANGTTWLAQGYNGDALQRMVDHADLGFYLPVEGTSLWMDNMVIMKSSQNKELAYKFIDFLLDAANAKRNAEYTQYPTPNLAAYQLLDDEIKANLLIYPDEAYLQKCHMIQFIGERAGAIDKLFEQIRMN